ncbi:MAG: hypothetical protein JO360_09285 [Acidobacteria bacterium]|nr:hypothetical protein [Acidobacteriota bacterium]
MKKLLTTIWLGVFLLSVPVFGEGLSPSETSPGGSASELHQSIGVGVGRARTRRRVRRRVRRRQVRRARRHVRRMNMRRRMRRNRVMRGRGRIRVYRRR